LAIILGSGPRVCIGSRFALMEAKLLVFCILRKFTIQTCDKTPKSIEFVPDMFTLQLKEDIFVEFKKRK
jgi:cytochrome P450 family 9